MKKVRRIFLAVSALAAASCAASGNGLSSVPPVSTARGEGVVLSPLAEAALPKGECGMILWTLDQNRPAPVFRYVAGKTGALSIDGAPVTLTLVETAGEAAYGVFEEQTFVSPEGMTVKVSTQLSLGFDGGTYLERGLISVETADGWRSVTPSAGLAGCRK